MNETTVGGCLDSRERADGLLSISAFARAARLSLKALRLYDALGLLTPEHTDLGSGYRSYAPAQLPRARLIALLRQLHMPLARIRAVLDLPGPQAAGAVGAYWREVERDLDARRRLVHYLETFLSGKGENMYDVALREVPERKVVTVQRNLLVPELPDFIGGAQRQLGSVLSAAGLKAGSPALVIYHGRVDEDNDGPVEVCLPFEGTLEPQGELRIRLEPAHREAYITISEAQCEFPGILQAYDAVFAYAKRQGLTGIVSPREVYFTAQDRESDRTAATKTGAADAPFCDIAFPVA